VIDYVGRKWGFSMRALIYLFAACSMLSSAAAGEAFTIHDAIEQAIHTNPAVGEAAADRRATSASLGQQQGTLLPQIRLEATAGPERLNSSSIPAPLNNDRWMSGRDVSIVGRLKLFDGFSSINEIWRQAARVDAASYRVHERTELVALDAAEAYIDVVRYTQLVGLAEENLRAHRKIFDNVRARFNGGRSGEGDLEQGRERLSGAEATLYDFRRGLDDARAKYRKVIGLEPYNIRHPGRLPNLPTSKDDALAITLGNNPTIKSAGSDAKAAKYAFDATTGLFLPNASLEARALRGADSIIYPGYRTEESVKVVVSWDIFTGFQDSWKRAGAADRMVEATQKEARLQRDALESVDKAWAARTITNERIAALSREVASGKKVIASYNKEYELGQRTLTDLLNAESIMFNSYVSLISSRSVAVFADYQLLATMGKLLEYLKTGAPYEAAPLQDNVFGLVPMTIPPIIITAPDVGPRPLLADTNFAALRGADSIWSGPSVFDDRWLAPGAQPSWVPAVALLPTPTPTPTAK